MVTYTSKINMGRDVFQTIANPTRRQRMNRGNSFRKHGQNRNTLSAGEDQRILLHLSAKWILVLNINIYLASARLKVMSSGTQAFIKK